MSEPRQSVGEVPILIRGGEKRSVVLIRKEAAFYSDNDPKACAWLRELIREGHLPEGTVDERDIRDLQAKDLQDCRQVHLFAGIGGWPYALHLAGWPAARPVWTGSCPCQPFSAAGKRKGGTDERHLWPAFFRLIRECRPPVVFGEQVSGRAGYDWLARVSADLESQGYRVGAADLPAACVGAPHIRQRLFWVADSADIRRERLPAVRRSDETAKANRRVQQSEGGRSMCPKCEQFFAKFRCNSPDECDCPKCQGLCECGDGKCPVCFSRTVDGICGHKGCMSHGTRRLADADGRQPGDGGLQRGGQHGRQPEDGGTGGVGDADGRRRQQHGGAVSDEQEMGQAKPERPGDTGGVGDAMQYGRREGSGDADGSDVAQISNRQSEPRGVGISASHWSDSVLIPCRDGKARRIEPGIFPLAPGLPGRVGLLRGAGNAIVPAVGAAFVKAYLEADPTHA